MFDSKYKKILITDLEALTLEIQEMREQIDTLTAENKKLKENQSEFLMGVVKKQSDTIKTLSHYQSQDEALYSYEQSNAKDKAEIKKLKAELLEARSLTDNYKQAYTLESNMSDLLIERVVSTKKSCVEYDTVSLLDIRG
jgi:cell division protein FtsB